MTSPNWAGTTFFSVLEFLYEAFGICFMDHGKLMHILSGEETFVFGEAWQPSQTPGETC